MNIDVCDPDRLDAFLMGSLSVVEEERLTSHLDSCDVCRSELEQRAANGTSWAEVSNLLAKPNSIGTASVETESADSSAFELPLAIRQVLDLLAPTDDPASMGRIEGFEILGVVGSGAMGVVLKAEDRTLDRVAALKVMNPSLAVCGTARQRFAREAKAAAAILHPNVIPIHAVSVSHSLPYLVMPYVKGMSLQQRLDKHGPLSLQEILRIGSQLAAGIGAAHRTGLIHRDIKPSNVMLDVGVETALITDFGLARTIDDATLTRSGSITGTPEYMSPEQARGDSIDFSSDVFSLGSVLYVLCTGRPPFRAQTAFGVLRRITDEEPPAIRDINSDIPHWLVQLIQRLLSKDPAARPTAEEAQSLLEQCLAHAYQPDRVPLPDELKQLPSSVAAKFSRPLQMGVLMLIVVTSIIAFAISQPTVDDTPVETSTESTTEQLVEVSLPKKSQPKVFKTLNLDFPDPSQTGLVVIDINRGFVEVVGHDQQHVQIDILEPPSLQRTKNSSALKQQFSPKYDLRKDPAKNEIELDTYNQDYALNLRVKVPLKTNLELDTYYDGYLKVQGVSGKIDTHSQNCDISLLDISGSATAFSYNGILTAKFLDVAEDAQLDFESYNGSVNLAFPKNVALTTAVSSGRGSYGSMFDIKPLDAAARDTLLSGNQKVKASYRLGTINGGGIPLRIESEKGVISLRKLESK